MCVQCESKWPVRDGAGADCMYLDMLTRRVHACVRHANGEACWAGDLVVSPAACSVIFAHNSHTPAFHLTGMSVFPQQHEFRTLHGV